MEKETEIELKVQIARIEERQINDLKERERFNSDLSNSIRLISVQLNKSNAEREGDIHSLKFSLKKKINESVNRLNEYHDKDLIPIKDDLGNLTLWVFLQKKKGYLILFAVVVLFTFGEKIYGIIKHNMEEQGIELIEPENTTDNNCNNYWITGIDYENN